MRDVEEPSSGPSMEMFGENSRRVLHRHVVAGESDHPRAELDVQRVERRLAQFGLRHRAAVLERMRRNWPPIATPVTTPPLSRDLRDFPPPFREAVTPVGGPALSAGRFPECHPL